MHDDEGQRIIPWLMRTIVIVAEVSTSSDIDSKRHRTPIISNSQNYTRNNIDDDEHKTVLGRNEAASTSARPSSFIRR